MSEPKTKPTDEDPRRFITERAPESRRADSLELLDILDRITGQKPVMWGEAIIGYGRYTVVNSTQKPQVWPLIGFSPRKDALTLYLMYGFSDQAALLTRLGKHKTSKACLYIKRLADIDRPALEDLLTWSYEAAVAHYGAPE